MLTARGGHVECIGLDNCIDIVILVVFELRIAPYPCFFHNAVQFPCVGLLSAIFLNQVARWSFCFEILLWNPSAATRQNRGRWKS